MRKVVCIFGLLAFNIYGMVMDANSSNKRSYSQVTKTKENVCSKRIKKNITDREVFDLIEKLRNYARKNLSEEVESDNNRFGDKILSELEELRKEKEKRNTRIEELTQQNKMLKTRVEELVKQIELMKKDEGNKIQTRNAIRNQLPSPPQMSNRNNEIMRTPVLSQSNFSQNILLKAERSQIALPSPQREESVMGNAFSGRIVQPLETTAYEPLWAMNAYTAPEMNQGNVLLPQPLAMPEVPVQKGHFYARRPEFVFDLPFMVIDANSLKRLPIEVTDYSGLVHLAVRGTIGEDLEKRIKLSILISKAFNLEVLDLEETQLGRILEPICNLRNLRTLNLSNNKIKKLPGSFGMLINLRKLILSKNELVELPETIGLLLNLRELNLSINFLRRLPVSMSNLKNLEILNLFSNKLKYFPESLIYLPKLKQMDLRKNEQISSPKITGREVTIQRG